ncbi:MAG: flagellar motor protein MotA [Alphaproteobacteria bacterium]|nr:flagellar motor protein MotA [Alphaproteobacteria bacterium]
MTRPQRYLMRMALFLAAVAACTGVLVGPLAASFAHNPWLNGMILGVLLVGILYNFRIVMTLFPEVRWIESFKRDRAGSTTAEPPDASRLRLLAPMATMLGEKKGRLVLSGPSMRTILDGVGTRLEESRDISRYMIGLLVFLGLLGTFWGLLHTVGSVGRVIGSLTASGDSDFASMFAELKSGLEAPLGGMGTAFSSSLFGLAGSLVLGFLELQAGQAQNRFYNDVEEWLSGLTRLSGGGPGGEDQSIPAYIQALLEQTADSLDNLQRIMAAAEDHRGQVNAQMLNLNERLAAFTEQMRTERQLMLRLAENQLELKPVMARLVDAVGEGKLGLDDTSRAHLRNLEIYAARLLEELAAGRAQSMHEIRNEIRLLARTIAAVAEEEQR